MNPLPIRKCKSCDAAIIWALITRGKRIPVDAESSLDGNILLTTRDDGTVIALVRGSPVVGGDDYHRPHHKAHFATCPNAADHRKGDE